MVRDGGDRAGDATRRSRWTRRVVRKADDLRQRVQAAAADPRAALFRWTAPTRNERLLRLVTARPVTLSEKIRWKMVRDRRPLLGDFADKVESKRYVARVVGAEYAVPMLAVFDDAHAIDTGGFPDEFVVKASHASKGVVLVRHDAPRGVRLPEPGSPLERYSVHPEAFDVDRARGVFAGWLAVPFGVRDAEWAYSVHPPRVVVEPMLRTTSGQPIRDVRCFVMNGRVALVNVIEEHPEGRFWSRYLPDGTHLAHVRSKSYIDTYDVPPPSPAPLPAPLAEMIDVAQRVARETDFLRVDMLDLGDRFLVGELTNYPAAGMETIKPTSFSRWLGAQWTLPASYESNGE
jgi:hypothetical protein